jgi:hypothetical protein
MGCTDLVSATWTWEPVADPPPGGALSLAMIDALAGSGPFDGREHLPGRHLTLSDVPFLRGVLAGAPEGSELAEDATALLDAIRTHGRVRIGRET